MIGRRLDWLKEKHFIWGSRSTWRGIVPFRRSGTLQSAGAPGFPWAALPPGRGWLHSRVCCTPNILGFPCCFILRLLPLCTQTDFSSCLARWKDGRPIHGLPGAVIVLDLSYEFIESVFPDSISFVFILSYPFSIWVILFAYVSLWAPKSLFKKDKKYVHN